MGLAASDGDRIQRTYREVVSKMVERVLHRGTARCRWQRAPAGSSPAHLERQGGATQRPTLAARDSVRDSGCSTSLARTFQGRRQTPHANKASGLQPSMTFIPYQLSQENRFQLSQQVVSAFTLTVTYINETINDFYAFCCF